VLAYGFRLLEMRVSAATPADQDGLAGLVRHECYLLVSRASWRQRNRCQRLPAPDPALSHSRYADLYPIRADGGAGRDRLTKEIFDQFCHCTGLGSNVLVGKGENLATLVFYIAVHGAISSRGLLTREEILRLLRAASRCGTRLQQAISQWLQPEPAARRELAQAGSQAQLKSTDPMAC
jgi:hypothetical protein